MAITRIEVKDGKLLIDFTPSDAEKTSMEFDSRTNKLIVDTFPSAIDIIHKEGKFIIKPRAKESAERSSKPQDKSQKR